jgi:N-acetylglutamate synthase-like GNAT family acetyltransferase
MAKAGYTIRAATPADADAVTALLAASYGPAFFAGWHEPDLLARALPLMARANPDLLAAGTYHVAALADGSLVGCGGWTAGEPGTGRIVPGLAHIRHFATHPDWARRGIAGALLAHSLREADAQGATHMECLSTLPAERFYRAHGFERIRPLEVPLTKDTRLPGILMRRELG